VRRGLVAVGAVAVACAPTLTSTDSLVTSPRILAVRAEPAEAKPGALITFDALVAAPPGAPTGVPAWSFCLAPKPLTEDNVVSDACFDTSALRVAGEGATITASTPSNGCSLFGPDAPAGGLRPRDPDSTGGYYQPVRVDLGAADPTLALARISCDLASASAASAAAFAQLYVPNENPRLLPLIASVGGSTVALDAVPVGTRVDLTVAWPASSAETYAYYDEASDTVGTKRESMTLAWYSSSGPLDREATGRAGDDMATFSSNAWTAPPSAGTSQLWIVLRDSRGGVDFASYRLTTILTR
jgi:hypothetical protein